MVCQDIGLMFRGVPYVATRLKELSVGDEIWDEFTEKVKAYYNSKGMTKWEEEKLDYVFATPSRYQFEDGLDLLDFPDDDTEFVTDLYMSIVKRM